MRTDRIALAPEHVRAVRRILKAWAPSREVWVFGSRARDSAKPHSDLDLAIQGDEPLAADARAGLVDAFEESDLPFRVDVVEWATLSEDFRAVVARDHAVLQEADARPDSAEPRFEASPPSP
jgi:type I restriction enzyme S subunit